MSKRAAGRMRGRLRAAKDAVLVAFHRMNRLHDKMVREYVPPPSDYRSNSCGMCGELAYAKVTWGSHVMQSQIVCKRHSDQLWSMVKDLVALGLQNYSVSSLN